MSSYELIQLRKAFSKLHNGLTSVDNMVSHLILKSSYSVKMS